MSRFHSRIALIMQTRQWVFLEDIEHLIEEYTGILNQRLVDYADMQRLSVIELVLDKTDLTEKHVYELGELYSTIIHKHSLLEKNNYLDSRIRFLRQFSALRDALT